MQDLHSDDNDDDSEDDDDNDMDSDMERLAHTHLTHHQRRSVTRLALRRGLSLEGFEVAFSVMLKRVAVVSLPRVSLSDGSESDSSSPSPPSHNEAPPLLKTTANQVRR